MKARTTITINASAAKVWKAITTPASIKKYLMGTTVETDWKVGSPISYQGEYNGKTYHDKGTIKRIESEKIFESTYWSEMGGKEDKPENYNLVTYKLTKKGNQTQVMLTQDNITSEKEKINMVKNWKAVLKKLKEVAEE